MPLFRPEAEGRREVYLDPVLFDFPFWDVCPQLKSAQVVRPVGAMRPALYL
jgi:hypothetical protein